MPTSANQSYLISGIQQMGVGVSDVEAAWKFYRNYFNVDVPVFKEEAVAELMLPYTDGQPRARYAVLALNMQGGGGFEIWQYTERTPQPPQFTPQPGDRGIYGCKLKSRDAQATYNFFRSEGLDLLTEVAPAPDGTPHFYVRDPYGNVFELVESKSWFQKTKGSTGGVYGATVGTTNVDRAIELYGGLLGYDETVYDETGTFDDLDGLPGGAGQYRRVLLRHRAPRKGAFANFFGSTEIELIQTLDRKPRDIFEGRLWGDLGFIHLCYDINGMDALSEACTAAGFPFTVDSGKHSFDMGEAAGRFAYIEDPDGALIEFVETHKVPIAKKLGFYLNLRGRNPEKPLPRLVIQALGLNRRRD